MFNGLACSFPTRTDFKYLDAVPFHTKCKINFFAKSCRWSTPFNELGDQSFASFDFKFAECHDCSIQRDRECLDHVVVFGERHLRHLLAVLTRPTITRLARTFRSTRTRRRREQYKDAVRKSSVIRRTAKASRSEIELFDRSRGRRDHLHKYIRFCHRQRTALSATDKRRAICCGIELCTRGMSG